MIHPHESPTLRICAFVHEILCEHNELEVNAFPMTERILVRSGKPCGLYFCLHGPRSVKLTAIWETDRNCVLLYSSSGECVRRVQLSHVPSLACAPSVG